LDVLTGTVTTVYNLNSMMVALIPNANWRYVSNFCISDNYNAAGRLGVQDRFPWTWACVQGEQRLLDMKAQTITPLVNGAIAGDPVQIPNFPIMPQNPVNHNTKMDQSGRFVRITVNSSTTAHMLFWDLYAPLNKAFLLIPPFGGSTGVPNFAGGHSAHAWGTALNLTNVNPPNTYGGVFVAIRRIVNANDVLDLAMTQHPNVTNTFIWPAGVPRGGGDAYMSWNNQRKGMHAPVLVTGKDGSSTGTYPNQVFNPNKAPQDREMWISATDNPPYCTRWRVCHNWNRMNNYGSGPNFSDGAFGNLSRDGRYCLFSSSMANTLGGTNNFRTDCFLVELL
jgi:hypothetical protein